MYYTSANCYYTYGFIPKFNLSTRGWTDDRSISYNMKPTYDGVTWRWSIVDEAHVSTEPKMPSEKDLADFLSRQ